MNALGMFAYLIGCLIVAAVLTIVVAAFRPVKKNDDFRSWRYTFAFFILVAAAPYMYASLMTQKYGSDVEEAVHKTFKSAKVEGKVKYMRVLKMGDESARVIAVGREKTTLTDAESVVMRIDLVNDPKKGWVAKEYVFVDSFKRGKDSVTFPPYW